MTKQEIKAEIRRIRAEMRARGIQRLSCFNGGHTTESYKLNAKLFELETLLKRAA